MADNVGAELPTPTPQLLRPTNPRSVAHLRDAEDDREDNELQDFRAQDAAQREVPVNVPADEQSVPARQRRQHRPHWYDPVRSFWVHYICLTVPLSECRDHLGGSSVPRCFRLSENSLVTFPHEERTQYTSP